MKNKNITNFGSLFCFWVFELKNNNQEKAEEYFNQLDSHLKEIKPLKHVEIFESETLKNYFLEKIQENKETKLIDLLRNDLVNKTIFDDSYSEVFLKLEK